ncbi:MULTISPECIES: hypothetical protein [Acetobacter]|uniref:Phage head morphogenesis domain-containing protein n=1 Tax=Acetobacter persici TaxID=1076596 RepID=A0A1U9LBE4_9PROT|nr:MULTISPECIES: hypothetical protein [Acetobacter]AQT03719.1 hypothetical protein A0U91_00180 [Acetobacter persici]KAA8385859.1 hypothetical protein FKW31_07905 [Acetobacter sp. DmW_136]
MIWGWFKKKPAKEEKPERVYTPPLSRGLSADAEALTIKANRDWFTADIEEAVREQIDALQEVPESERGFIMDQAKQSFSSGGDLGRFSWALREIGIERRRAAEIAHDINGRVTALINRARQIETGIYAAEWMHSGAPCFFPFGESKRRAARSGLHEKADGKRYDVRKGLKIGSKWTHPGMEPGCKCVSRIILKGFNDK